MELDKRINTTELYYRAMQRKISIAPGRMFTLQEQYTNCMLLSYGKTWSLERRKKLAELSARYAIPVIEDNPYGELRFEGESLPSIKSFDEVGNILCAGSFSKLHVFPVGF